MKVLNNESGMSPPWARHGWAWLVAPQGSEPQAFAALHARSPYMKAEGARSVAGDIGLSEHGSLTGINH